MESVNRPVIFVLSLMFREFLDESYSSLFNRLNESTQLRRAKVASEAIQYLEESSPRAILVTDEGLTKTENRVVLDKVVLYVRNGGLVIFGLHFPNFTRMDDFDNFFNRAFGIPWKHGDYHRSDFKLNPTCSLPLGAASDSLPAPYSMKVLHVKNAQPHEKVFIPVSGAKTQSSVFPTEYVDQAQAAVVAANVGNGYLVYCGDVNPGDASDSVILSLCGL
ncbi:hypothetical protein VE01_08955 [Pseudogymnoascus verrucosus]|uniref:Uncharacterized protein n=1 Tax=Pseudogymnoascus verrucosus TaxID=342668 RepID=A0A1B8GAR2_9PEZI|nr:uncharacterized protein VE01_08955 [Pseudogymnoascus verrucosus]OBT92911.1 hypothetical protein VE01_08955 [Pseudogymnoascus verrucosus]